MTIKFGTLYEPQSTDRYDFSFAQNLCIKVKSAAAGSIDNIKHVVSQLKHEYCFPILGCSVDFEYNRFVVIVFEKCSDIQKDWIREVVKYYLPLGIDLEIGVYKGSNKVLLESDISQLLIRGELTFE